LLARPGITWCKAFGPPVEVPIRTSFLRGSVVFRVFFFKLIVQGWRFFLISTPLYKFCNFFPHLLQFEFSFKFIGNVFHIAGISGWKAWRLNLPRHFEGLSGLLGAFFGQL
jgi:hypothetical protein